MRHLDLQYAMDMKILVSRVSSDLKGTLSREQYEVDKVTPSTIGSQPLSLTNPVIAQGPHGQDGHGGRGGGHAWVSQCRHFP